MTRTLTPTKADSEYPPIPDMTEAMKRADCIAYAMRERQEMNQRKYWKRREQERVR